MWPIFSCITEHDNAVVAQLTLYLLIRFLNKLAYSNSSRYVCSTSMTLFFMYFGL